MDIQHFEYTNMLSELETLNPEEKKEYFSRNNLFFKNQVPYWKTPGLKNISTTTKTPELVGAATGHCGAVPIPELEIVRIKNQEHFFNRNKRSFLIDCAAPSAPPAPIATMAPTAPGEPEIFVLDDSNMDHEVNENDISGNDHHHSLWRSLSTLTL